VADAVSSADALVLLGTAGFGALMGAFANSVVEERRAKKALEELDDQRLLDRVRNLEIAMGRVEGRVGLPPIHLQERTDQ
jgi:hypothetical protein